jgi:hypothetical protein
MKKGVLVILLLFLLTGGMGCGPGATESPGPEISGGSLENATVSSITDKPAADLENGEGTENPENSENAISEKLEAAQEEQAEQKEASPVPGVFCKLSITCHQLLANPDLLPEGKQELIPASGVILPSTEITLEEGATVFDLLQKGTRQQGIHMEFTRTPIYNSTYIEGIHNLYEFDGGELSGWMYRVNGTFPNRGASAYRLTDGDQVEWVYTLDLGRDVGGDYLEQKGE